ncbi:hypothetical protein K1T35_31920 [Pseudonocardia sp. DSM 110487]|uniref:hypothetical protein n=1 Tax=Pseudonocardia sp. DSM 110487 TaxID=2865833 RepID=UPI001C6973B4|nr:hypothetical protein [Pseudonocardia sp. DSM 110487]QYN33115.1 hypothetical protein K1T35_31920 [Pseudonocardia sp. DSM 110487]
MLVCEQPRRGSRRDTRPRHALLAAVRDERHAADGALSHVSAAVLHGLSTWGLPLDRIHRTRDRRTGGRVGNGVHLHAAPLTPDEVDEVDGLLVTSVARTVVDLARTAGFDAAVAVADSALHKRRGFAASPAGARWRR